MAKLSDEKIAEIQKRYAECGVYAQVARELGVSPATVKKYVSLLTLRAVQKLVFLSPNLRVNLFLLNKLCLL